MDGVLWRGGATLPGLQELFATLRGLDIGFVLATNNASSTPGHYVNKLAGFGVAIDAGSVITSAIATAQYLAETLPPPRRAFVIGEEGLVEALRNRDYDVVTASPGTGRDASIVVVGYDRGLTYPKLAEATRLILLGATFVATNSDVTFPGEGGLLPGVGATLAALSAATGVEPRAVGKPAAAMFDAALVALDVPADSAVMVGDRLETDILGAQRAGLSTVLVTTGVDDANAVARTGIEPDAIAEGLPEIVAALQLP
jgi:4-nitrophenyl phosphatase